MKPTSLPYRSWARLLLVLLGLTWTFRTFHGYWLHTEEQRNAICSAEHRGAMPHLHQHHDGEQNCPVCAFYFAIPDVPAILEWPEFVLTPPCARTEVACPSPHLHLALVAVHLRGPPIRPMFIGSF